jgi:hypothetical protein
MNIHHMNDQQLLDNAIATVRDVRARAPHEFLVLLAILLGVLLAAILLLAALLPDPALKDVLLNVGAEIFGAWLTVVLIDGLWRRFQLGSISEYEAMTKELTRRKKNPLSDDERQAWALYIELFRQIEAGRRSNNIVQYIRVLYTAWHKARQLEAQGNQVLKDFEKRIKTQVAEDQIDLQTPEGAREELVALKNEVVKLRQLIEQGVAHRELTETRVL